MSAGGCMGIAQEVEYSYVEEETLIPDPEYFSLCCYLNTKPSTEFPEGS